MPSKLSIVIFLLLLLPVSLTAAAEDVIQPRGCRRGRIPATKALTRQNTTLLKEGRAASVNPYIGDRRQLVVLAAFSDKSFVGDSLATLQKWDMIFNQEGYQDEWYVGSVHDYFFDQSYGQFNLTFDLHYMTLGKSSRYASTKYDDNNSQFLVNDIVDSLLVRGIDWSAYDWSGNGDISQILIVFAGKGMNDGGGSNSIWPHQWWLSWHYDKDDPSSSVPSRKIEYAGNVYTVDNYCAVQSQGSNYDPFGTVCHEYSHCFGLPDFYYSATSFVFGWDLMDYGNYNGNGFCPTGYSAHERMLMGWLTPIPLTETAQITAMSPLHLKNEAYILYNDADEHEFYMIEHRQKQSWDRFLPNSGIVVFHIDYDDEIWKKGMPNNLADQRYVIIPANNEWYYNYSKMSHEQAYWAYPYDGNNQLTNNSTPAATLWHANTDSTLLMNKSVTDMEVADGLASFAFEPLPTSVTEISQQRPVEKGIYYNLSGQRVTAPRKGIYIHNGKKYVFAD